MKKIFSTLLLFALTMSAMAADINYKVAPVSVTVEDNSTSSKPKFNLTIEQKSYRLSNSTKYSATTHLVLYPETHELAGTYTTSDNSLHPSTSDVTVDGSVRRPSYATGRVSTITIVKVSEGKYAITDGDMIVSTMGSSSTWCYEFCYAMDKWDEKAPFEFTFGGEEEDKPEPHVHYDMTVNGVHVERQDNDYGTTRYFMVLNCAGKRRDNNATYNYEVQLDLLPTGESISGTFATVGSSQILGSTDTYVKWLQSETKSTTRYVAKDSLSTITIKSNGTNQYKFCGGTLICQDVTFGVMGEKKINQTLYYHFNDEVSFGFDENNKSYVFTPSAVEVENTADGYTYRLEGTVEGIDYTIVIINESSSKTGTFTTSNSLSTWSKVEHGSVSSYIAENGSTITIQSVGENLYSLSGTLICENDNTYEIESINFSYPLSTGVAAARQEADSRKTLRGGRLIIERNGQIYNALGQTEK